MSDASLVSLKEFFLKRQNEINNCIIYLTPFWRAPGYLKYIRCLKLYYIPRNRKWKKWKIKWKKNFFYRNYGSKNENKLEYEMVKPGIFSGETSRFIYLFIYLQPIFNVHLFTILSLRSFYEGSIHLIKSRTDFISDIIFRNWILESVFISTLKVKMKQ